MHDATQLPENNRHALRLVARSCRKASLASLLVEGRDPYASLVTVAFDLDLAPILLLSNLADHTRNLAADPRASLLLDGTDGHLNPQTGPRVTLCGHAEKVTDERLRTRFLARHPGAALYADFADFSIWKVVPERAHFVGGFGRAVWFDAPFGLSPTVVAEIARCESALIAEANGVHAAALARLGTGWRITALDPDGIDLTSHDDFRRLAFPASVDDNHSIRSAMAGVLDRNVS